MFQSSYNRIQLIIFFRERAELSPFRTSIDFGVLLRGVSFNLMLILCAVEFSTLNAHVGSLNCAFLAFCKTHYG